VDKQLLTFDEIKQIMEAKETVEYDEEGNKTGELVINADLAHLLMYNVAEQRLDELIQLRKDIKDLEMIEVDGAERRVVRRKVLELVEKMQDNL